MTGAGLSQADRDRGVAAYAAIRAAGFSDVRTAMQVAYAESGWDQSARNTNRNGSVDYGLFQINSVHKPSEAVKTNIVANAAFARSLQAKQGWKPWVAYTSGSYSRGAPASTTTAFMAYASTAEGKSAINKALEAAKRGEHIGSGIVDAASGLGDAVDSAAEAAQAINPLNAVDTVKAGVQSVLEWLTDALSVILLYLVGFALICLGVYLAFKEPIKKVVGEPVSDVVDVVVGSKAKGVKNIVKRVAQ